VWLNDLSCNLLFGPPRIFWRTRAFGAERVPQRGPLLVACNHSSFLDPWFIAMIIPRRRLRFLINSRWYDRSRLWRFFFDSNGVLPASTNKPVETIGRVVVALRNGDVVALFPEGRISRDGRIQRGHAGIGWMAALSSVPVLPCGLRGNSDALPRGRFVPRPRPVHLHIGAPLVFPGSPLDRPDPGQVNAFAGSVMEQVCRLAGQEDRIPNCAPRVALDLGPQLDAWFAAQSDRPGR
jgi:1-acyl-sn-glycerol-3-phosphate acyltransferase